MTQPSDDSARSSPLGPGFRYAGLVVVSVFIYVAFRVALESVYTLFDPDEALTMLEAQSLLHAGLPYVDCYTHRGPLLSALYAFPLAIFGDYNVRAVHAFAVAAVAMAIVGIAVVTARAFGRAAGVLAAAVFVLVGSVTIPTEDNWALNSDLFMSLLASAGFLLLLWRSGTTLAPRHYCVSGVVLGLACLTKQNAVAYAAVPVGLILLADRRRAVAKLIAYLAGCTAPCVVVALVYAVAGEWSRFWYGFYVYNSAYAPPIAELRHSLPAHLAWISSRYGYVAPLALLGVLWLVLIHARAHWRDSCLVCLWLGAALVVTALPGRRWDNYLWAAHAPLSIAAAIGLAAPLRQPLARYPRFASMAVIALLLLLLVDTWPRILFADHFLQAMAQRPDTLVGGVMPQPQHKRSDLIALIQAHSQPDEPIYVTGYAPEIYVMAHRRYASRHVVSNFVETFLPGRNEVPLRVDSGFLAELESDLVRNPPRLIIDACANGYLCHPGSDLATRLLQRFDGLYEPLPEWPPGGVFLRRNHPLSPSF